MASSVQQPHGSMPVLSAGLPLDQARAALIMLHGRGSTAHNILSLAQALDHPGFAYLAPQAAKNTWYPHRFMEPLDSNEPYLSSALARVAEVLAMVTAAGVPVERTMLLGFSQGACLASEFVARNARRYGDVVVLTGGLIGPDGTPRDYSGSLAGTPIFMGCSDVDVHIPKERFLDSATVLRKLGGDVTERLYLQMGHIVNEDELAFARSMMSALVV